MKYLCSSLSVLTFHFTLLKYAILLGTLALTGPVADQAALFGLLARIRDLGLPLIAVNQLSINQPAQSRSDD